MSLADVAAIRIDTHHETCTLIDELHTGANDIFYRERVERLVEKHGPAALVAFGQDIVDRAADMVAGPLLGRRTKFPASDHRRALAAAHVPAGNIEAMRGSIAAVQFAGYRTFGYADAAIETFKNLLGSPDALDMFIGELIADYLHPAHNYAHMKYNRCSFGHSWPNAN